MNGRPLDRAVTLMIPEPWDKNPNISDKRRSYDAYQSMLMEPWDGPAAIAFTDGRILGAALDRNGLRPARYYVTRDDRIILSSEVGTIDVDPANVLRTGCLGPGEMLEVDPSQGRVIWNDEIRDRFANEKPYRDWLDEETLDISDLREPAAGELACAPDAGIPLTERMARLGYHYDDVDEAIRPMATAAKVPLASMGVDAPLACLSKKTRSFFDYFNQLFAQVTNPPIDALRESLVTSQVLYLGNHGNLLEDCRDTCRLVRLQGPMLTRDAFERLCAIDRVGFKTVRLTCSYPRDGQEGALAAALDRLAADVEAAVRGGANIVVLSDRAAVGEVPVPSLLSLGCVHNHLIRVGLRMNADLVVETGDAINAHDFACLVGYSASGIYPYMAHECIADLCEKGAIELPVKEAQANYDRAVTAGIVSIMSKMGISTMQGYHSAQIFEVLGLSDDLVERYFTSTATRIGGLGVNDVQRELSERYDAARALAKTPAPDQLPTLGLTKWRPQGGEEHLIDPKAVYLLQHACREGSYEEFKEFSAWVHRPGRAVTLRDLMGFSPKGAPVPLDEVEPVEGILTRFNTGAMSYGSISREQHECLAIAMNRIHGRSNTGEGGEDPRARDPASQRGLQEERHQAGGLRPLWRHEPLPEERPRDPDQDGPGRQARRGRPPARQEGLPVDRPRCASPRPASASSARRPTTTSTPSRTWPSSSLTSRTLTPTRASRSSSVPWRAWAPSPPVWPRAAPTRSPSRATTAVPARLRATPSTTPASPLRLAWPRPSRRSCATACAPASWWRRTASS